MAGKVGEIKSGPIESAMKAFIIAGAIMVGVVVAGGAIGGVIGYHVGGGLGAAIGTVSGAGVTIGGGALISKLSE